MAHGENSPRGQSAPQQKRTEIMNESILLTALVVAAIIAITALLGKRRNRARQHPPVPVRFTNHSRERMTQRGVTRREIEEVLAAPTRAIRDLSAGSVRLERDYPGRVLKVWVVAPWPATTEIVVKTTAWNYIEQLPIPAGSAGHLIGKHGTRVRGISERTGARISVSDTSIRIEAGSATPVSAAKSEIANALKRFAMHA